MDQVLAALDGEHGMGGGVLGYLNTREACPFRTANRCAKAAVRRFAWGDTQTRIAGSMASWRACFPKATKANLSRRSNLRHHEFPNLRGVTYLNLSYCECYSICNETFAYLSEVRILNFANSWQDPTVWAVFRDSFNDHLFKHLVNLETLNLDGFRYTKFTGAFAAHLPRLRHLSLRHWTEGPTRVDRFMADLQREHKVLLFIQNCHWVYDHWVCIPPNAILSS